MNEQPASTPTRRTRSGRSRPPTGASQPSADSSQPSSDSATSAASETSTPNAFSLHGLEAPSRKLLFDTAKRMKQLARIIEQQATSYLDVELPAVQGGAYEGLQRILVELSAPSLTDKGQT